MRCGIHLREISIELWMIVYLIRWLVHDTIFLGSTIHSEDKQKLNSDFITERKDQGMPYTGTSFAQQENA